MLIETLHEQNQSINKSSLIQTYEVHRTTQLQMYNKNNKRKKEKKTVKNTVIVK